MTRKTVPLAPETFRASSDPVESAWIAHEWIVSHLDAHGLSAAIPFIPPPKDPGDWRALVGALAHAVGTLDRSELPDFHGELERLKVQAVVSSTEPTSGDRLLTVQDVARRLSVDESWVYEAARSGKLEVLKIGKYRRFSERAVTDYLKKYGGKPQVL